MWPQRQFPPPSSRPASHNQFPGPRPHPPPTTASPLTFSSPKSLESPQTVGEGSFLDGVMVRLAPLSQPQPQPQLHSWSPLIREPWKRRGAGVGVKGENAEFIAIETPSPSLPPPSLAAVVSPSQGGVPTPGVWRRRWIVCWTVDCCCCNPLTFKHMPLYTFIPSGLTFFFWSANL